MFKIIIANHNNTPLTVRIKDCPRSGIEAVDFRRAAGLPEEPTNRIELVPAAITDEQAARRLRLDSNANYPANYRFTDQKIAHRNGSGACETASLDSWKGGFPFIDAAAIKAWNENQNTATALALIDSVDRISKEEEAFAAREIEEAKAANEAKEAAIAAARELLKDEIAKKDSRIAYLEGELKEARETIEELEKEAV